MPHSYPWYESIAGIDLEQGDFFQSCPILLPGEELLEKDPEALPEQQADFIRQDVILVNQSCDLAHDKLKMATACAHWTLDQMGDTFPLFKTPKGREQLRRGIFPGYHLLNRCDLPGFDWGYRVVDFRTIYSIPVAYLKKAAERQPQRLRLLSPYKEHLSQAFARFFMRVGLPTDIPKFD